MLGLKLEHVSKKGSLQANLFQWVYYEEKNDISKWMVYLKSLGDFLSRYRFFLVLVSVPPCLTQNQTTFRFGKDQ